MAEIFPELRYTNDVASSLVLEADKEDNPDSVDAPKTRPRVFAERSKFADLVVFLVGKMTELARLSWCGVYRNVFVNLDIVRFIVDGNRHSDGARWALRWRMMGDGQR